ncbi:MAG: hypothetical protein IJX76_05260 [Clostridia bacterium]|nr:hypothetical protein [Clostridia bacterium]
MKKRISMILSVILALSLFTVSMTSCDEDGNSSKDDDGVTLNGKSPEEAYNDALEAINNTDNYEMTSKQDIDIEMTYSGQTMNQEQKQTIQQKKNGDDIYVKVGGASLEQETWYVDGVLYTISGDTKAKAELSLEEFTEQMMGESSNNLLNIPESWFKDVEFKTEDGQKTLEFKIDGNEYLELVGNMLDSLGASADDMDISEVVYTVYFTDDGAIEKIVTVFSASFSIQGVEATANYNTVTTISIGTAGEITAPADGDSYIDVTEQMKEQY